MVICPACGLDTLSESGGFEICWVCWWEDDGQGDWDAELVTGGPNYDLSLKRARENFQKYYYIKEPKDPEKYFQVTAERNDLIKQVISLYEKLEKALRKTEIIRQIEEIEKKLSDMHVSKYYSDWKKENASDSIYSRMRTEEEKEEFESLLKKMKEKSE
jgi:hypothetical protein